MFCLFLDMSCWVLPGWIVKNMIYNDLVKIMVLTAWVSEFSQRKCFESSTPLLLVLIGIINKAKRMKMQVHLVLKGHPVTLIFQGVSVSQSHGLCRQTLSMELRSEKSLSVFYNLLKNIILCLSYNFGFALSHNKTCLYANIAAQNPALFPTPPNSGPSL